jgi:hypothetical protein
VANRWASLDERFWAKVAKGDGCWEWTGARAPSGYGRFTDNYRQRIAHRVAYEITVGPISDDLTIDHLCGNKGCVRPSHLEPVTRGENVRRYTRQITHCPQGHPYSGDNLIIRREGWRWCRTCRSNNRELRNLRRRRAS